MRRSQILILSILCIVSLSSCAKAPAPEPARDTAADEAAIRAMTDTFLKAYNAADLVGIGSNTMDDAVEMREGGPDLVGKSAIMAEAVKPFADNTMRQMATVDEVAVWGDVGMSRGTWEITQTPKAGGGKPVVTRGKWLVLHKRAADGSWNGWRHIWNMDPPPAGAVP